MPIPNRSLNLTLKLLAISLIGSGAANGQTAMERRTANQAEIDRSRALIEEYYELQRQIDAAVKRARTEKQVLGGRTELLSTEIRRLTESNTEQKEGITEADKERQKLIAEDEHLDKAKQANLTKVETFERRVRFMLPSLPPPLVAKLADMVSRMPDADKAREEINATVSSRFAAVLGILDQISRFDSDITVVPEVRELEDGRKIEVQTLYLGLAHAFYAGSGDSADVAGVGVPTQTGWRWQERPAEAKAISRAIKQYSREEPAEFLALPIELNDPADKR